MTAHVFLPGNATTPCVAALPCLEVLLSTRAGERADPLIDIWCAMTRELDDALDFAYDNVRFRGKVVIIRDSALFAGSDEHATSAGHILSLIASARLHGVEPQAYLRGLIRVLPYWPRDRYLELAPKFWTDTRARIEPNQLAPEVGVIDVPHRLPATTDPAK